MPDCWSNSVVFALRPCAAPVVGGLQGGPGKANLLMGAVPALRARCAATPTGAHRCLSMFAVWGHDVLVHRTCLCITALSRHVSWWDNSPTEGPAVGGRQRGWSDSGAAGVQLAPPGGDDEALLRRVPETPTS